VGGQRVLFEHGTGFTIHDKHPVTEAHHLIVPKWHVADYLEMSDIERRDAEALLVVLREQIVKVDSTVTGFNVGMNCGEVAGQTVMHAHVHLIPRRVGNVTVDT